MITWYNILFNNYKPNVEMDDDRILGLLDGGAGDELARDKKQLSKFR